MIIVKKLDVVCPFCGADVVVYDYGNDREIGIGDVGCITMYNHKDKTHLNCYAHIIHYSGKFHKSKRAAIKEYLTHLESMRRDK